MATGLQNILPPRTATRPAVNVNPSGLYGNPPMQQLQPKQADRSDARSRPLQTVPASRAACVSVGPGRKLAPIIWWRITLVRSKVLPNLGARRTQERERVETIHFCDPSVDVPWQAESNTIHYLDLPTCYHAGSLLQ